MLRNYAFSSPSLRALKTIDKLVQKIEFDGPSLTITSKNLAVGISAINSSSFIGSNFSAFVYQNSSDPQVHSSVVSVEFSIRQPFYRQNAECAQIAVPVLLCTFCTFVHISMMKRTKILYLVTVSDQCMGLVGPRPTLMNSRPTHSNAYIYSFS